MNKIAKITKISPYLAGTVNHATRNEMHGLAGMNNQRIYNGPDQ